MRLLRARLPEPQVTTTPRQRIVLRREMSRQPEWSKLLTRLQHEYEYDAMETCAVDGTCADVCPVGINTGALMKHFRKMEHGVGTEEIALDVAMKWGEVERLARVGVAAADVVQRVTSPHLLGLLTDAVRSAVSKDLVPAVAGPMPHAAPAELPRTKREGAAAAYFPACINRIFGRDNSKAASPALPEALVTLSARGFGDRSLIHPSRSALVDTCPNNVPSTYVCLADNGYRIASLFNRLEFPGSRLCTN